MKPDNPIILALDYSDLEDARAILHKVRPNIGMTKIGLELFTAYGKESLELSNEFNIPIFLDLKLHDIPKTVAKTVEVVCRLLSGFNHQHYLTIHCAGGREMCKEALLASQGSNVQLAGITLLTSLERRDFRELGFSDSRDATRTTDPGYIGTQCISKTEGLKTLVCAPTQLVVMQNHFKDVNFVTPGIRLDSEESHDHKRTKPASFALKNGATWIVVGRPITQAHDPVMAALHFQDQVDRYRP